MKQDQINIAIAEFCGWLNIRKIENGGQWRGHSLEPDEIWIGDSHNEGFCPRRLPNYYTSLDAMADAENFLKSEDPHIFACYCSDFVEEFGSDAICATAAQRAKSFVAINGLELK